MAHERGAAMGLVCKIVLMFGVSSETKTLFLKLREKRWLPSGEKKLLRCFSLKNFFL